MSQLLTQADRSYILTQLALAPDEILADAMLAFNAARDKIVAVRKLAGNISEAPTKVDTPEPEPVERADVSPGASPISKIGGTTKAQIMADLEAGKQPPAKFTDHLKLLWERKEVKFDGSEYYL